MLDRNKRIKPRPERFQNCKDYFDLVITCEERVYDQVVEDLNSREQETCQPVHVINVDIQDNHEEATLGAFLICELCQCVSLYILIWCTVAHFIKCRNGIYTWLPSFISQAALKF
ncbi:hypothetical protein AB205_0174740 [Aquarana catesbeiana]|uniref:RNA polymerase II subunit A C-terminal domain phosphatase SSU72 n=1 Tax=Aquarana catesbeiana TaxID=8400 RepID=A0A2G9RZ13_AQUCT|nr:hypothetical protein AB205_0174740 [Aquarana catesbeiana]